MDSLIKAHALKEELNGLRLNIEQEQKIMQKFRLDWNYHSNHLEGNSLTFGETKALILFGITAQGKPLKDHFEMTGHIEAILWVEDVIKNERALTQSFIRELHVLLLNEPYQIDAITPDGQPTKKMVHVVEYKSTPNHVKTITGEIFRFATVEETPGLMTDLLDWYAEKKQEENVDPVLLAAEFHYKFIRIHPFDDGNGRTARIIMNFILMQFAYPPVIIKTEDKQNYFSVLQQADAGILEPFIDYIATNLNRSLEIIIKGAKGESIEESDDIDKEISLLDVKLRNAGKKIELYRSEETLTFFYEKTALRIVKAFLEASDKFDVFFRSNTYIIRSSLNAKLGEPGISLIDLMSLFFTYNITYLQLIITHKELKYLGFEEFEIDYELSFDMENSLIKVKSFDFEKTLLYSEDFSNEELTQLTREVKLKVKNIIDTEIENETSQKN